eukprot:symbB.v1.2.012100.t1/scaffold821.1/size257772/10
MAEVHGKTADAKCAAAPETKEVLPVEEKATSPSRIAALKEEGAKVLTDAKAKAQEVARKVQSAEPVNSMMTKAAEMRTSATTAAADATGAARDRYTQLKTAAGESYESLKQKGLKSWLSENFESAKGMATRQVLWTVETSKNIMDSVKTGVHNKMQETLMSIKGTYAKGKSHAVNALDNAKGKANHAQQKAKEVVQDKHVQATAAGVVGGAATLGASGGATGLAAGTLCGAAIGVLPALFTFGLSIPVGAAIGGGAGLAVGASVGAAAGGVTGGAAGYQAYAKREQIGELRTNTVNKVTNSVDAASWQ